MTDAILGAVVEKSISLIQNEFATLSGLRKKAEKLSNTLILIRAVLEDAEERQMKDQAVKVWLQKLRDAAHVLDDILEDCSSESLQHGCLMSSFKPKNIIFRYRVGHKLKEMMETLDQIAKAKNDFGLREVVSERPSEVVEWHQTTPIIATPQVYGRDEDKKKVVQFLLSPDRGSDSISVYAIVGLGGLGKTTLAQLVHNDPEVSSHFNLKIWVCVSENFSLNGILRSIIECVMKNKSDIFELPAMEQKVQELLQSKRYLLVLDDVWKANQRFQFGVTQDKWDKLRSVLSCGSKGSSILVSTRDMDVASIMGTCHAHKLLGISDEDCWSLFKQRAFRTDREEPPELVKIGKEIAKKCGGSPLAAQALGCAMLTRSGKKQWLDVLKSELWTLPEENGILPALRLSYFHLTPTLKQCFAFCAIFPKDRKIEKQELIYLWMANGFISSRGDLDVEEVGNMVWNELYRKSFFQEVSIDDFGSISFKMHDLVHDLAQSITEKECVLLKEINVKDLPRNTHHIGFDDFSQTTFNKEALLFFHSLERTTLNKEYFLKFDSLRTLYLLPCFRMAWLPTSIRALCTGSLKSLSLGNLTHLRYLQLYNMNIRTLPDSIYNLCKLEVLKLIGLQVLHCLPKHLTRLKSLRHLVVEDCWSLSHMFPNIHKLSHLRKLSVYIVETETGHSLAELRDLNLGGELTIEGLSNVGRLSDAQDANLKGKGDLQKLHLSWEESDKTKLHLSWQEIDETKSHDTDAGQVLEALQPHPNLKSLGIRGYKGLHWPGWMGNNSLILNNLVSLYLHSCYNCVQLPPLGKLPYLKTLHLYGMKYVQYVEGGESYADFVEVRAFPSLEELTVSELPNLERLLQMETRHVFPCLSSLQVNSCPKLQLSFLPCVKDLTTLGDNIELLKSFSCLSTLDSLSLTSSEHITSFPEGMMNNLSTSVKHLTISFRKLKELPFEITKLKALESLKIENCDELESFPEQVLEGLHSLRSLDISSCGRLRCLPDRVRHLTSLEALTIKYCPTLVKRCEEGTGEDWPKIAHIPNITVW